MTVGGRTPAELDTLLEDAVVLRDPAALTALFEEGGLLIPPDGLPEDAPGLPPAAERVCAAGGHLFDGPRPVFRIQGLALAVGDRSVTVSRCGADGVWRYTFAVFANRTEEEHEMHTVVVKMSADPSRRDDVARHLREDVVPWARSQPGFVSGQWHMAPDGGAGGGVMLFDSADAAEQAAQAPRDYPRDAGRAWNVEQVDVYEQLVTADGSVLVGEM